ncbi:MAG: ATP-binding protein [Candidatus Anammoxibacter sp.]
MIDEESGHIVYSVFKEVDFATSLLTGPYKDTHFAKAFKDARHANDKEFVKLVDFEPYDPSYADPASFIASPIFDGEKKIGVLMFQMPTDEINRVMTGNYNWKNEGLGKSGETYIVGSDYKMRNDSRFFIEEPERYFELLEQIGTDMNVINSIKSHSTSVLFQGVYTAGVDDALKGNTDTKIIDDYRGIPVLSSYAPLDIEDVNWVMLSEIDKDEVFSGLYKLRNKIFTTMVIVVLFVMLFGFLISRAMSRPIILLTRRMKEVSKGDLSKRVNIVLNDEIGMLASSFNKMVDDLEYSRDNMVKSKQIIKDKNEELQKLLDQLKESQSMAIQSEKMSAIGTLVAGVAHELNNPIMGVVNYIQYCIEHSTNEDKRYVVHTVLQDAEHEIKRCVKIINNLLTFSRMENENKEAYQMVDCAGIFERILNLLSYRIKKERVSVTKHYGEKPPKCLANENNIQQVFMDIFINALDALGESEKKEVRISIHAVNEFVQVTISDSGPGIAPENLKKIFDPFFTTKPVGKGTGLGLSISNSIIKNHGGRITCNSKPCEGTEFKIFLPT